MKDFFILIIVLNIFFIVFYFIMSLISNKMSLNINIKEEISKQIEKLNLQTEIEVLYKVKPNYDLEDDKIQINCGNNIKTLGEAFHELGHAFYNHFYKYKIYNSNGEMIEYEYKDIELDFKFGELLGFLFTKSIILGLTFSLFGIILEINVLVFLGIAFSSISSILHLINLLEEVKATKIAKEIIKFEKFLSKNEFRILTFCLTNALYTYIFITVLSIGFVCVDTLFLLNLLPKIY